MSLSANITFRTRRVSTMLAPLLVLSTLFALFHPLEASAGWLRKKKEREQAGPEALLPEVKAKKGFQAIVPGRKAAAPQLRALPIEVEAPASPPVSAPANYAPSPWFSFSHSDNPLAPVPRARPGQARVFILGDSQGLLPFGVELQRALVESGYEVLFHAVKNGTPYYWNGKWPSPILTRVYEPAASPEQSGHWNEISMRPASVAEYVAAFDPEVFIFQAGTNFEDDLAANHPGLVKQIRASLDQALARGARVLWIGPPDARDDKRSAEDQERAANVLRSALAGISEAQGFDAFFDSRSVCPYPNDAPGDGEHPSDAAGKAWGVAAGAWVSSAIAYWEGWKALRPIGGSTPNSAPIQNFSEYAESHVASSAEPLRVELELLAKSDAGEIASLPYTDAFSVFRYRVKNAQAIQDRLSELGVPPAEDGGDPIVYVLHWSVHNNGSGPRATRVAMRSVGSTYQMSLLPLTEHPLGEALGTMTRFDDFNDFLAPIFASTDLLEEREAGAAW